MFELLKSLVLGWTSKTKPGEIDANNVVASFRIALIVAALAAGVTFVDTLIGYDWGVYSVIATSVGASLIEFLRRMSKDYSEKKDGN